MITLNPLELIRITSSASGEIDVIISYSIVKNGEQEYYSAYKTITKAGVFDIYLDENSQDNSIPSVDTRIISYISLYNKTAATQSMKISSYLYEVGVLAELHAFSLTQGNIKEFKENSWLDGYYIFEDILSKLTESQNTLLAQSILMTQQSALITQQSALIEQNANVGIRNGANLDAFSRLRVSNPTGLWQAQLTYGLQPLIYEAVTAEANAAVTFDSANRAATAVFSATPAGGKAFLQSYEYIHYQPGKSQLTFLTFNFNGGVADVTKFAGYSDGTNGIELQLLGSQLQIVLYSSSTNGNQLKTQANWNIDKLDGTGDSGIAIDVTKTQILVIDFQALFAGRVRVGFDINGQIYYCHQFFHSNIASNPYIAQATLPVRMGMTCTALATTTMQLICASVISEGGQEENAAYQFAVEGANTAASGVRTHLLSIRPKTTFNGIANRIKFVIDSVDFVVTGNQPVKFETVIGQALTAPVYADVNATYSAFEYVEAATLSGSPLVVFTSAYVPSSAQTKSSLNKQLSVKYPISLSAAGAVRDNGTLTILATGIGGTSTCRATVNWKEIR